jgi:hypothetical protein
MNMSRYLHIRLSSWIETWIQRVGDDRGDIPGWVLIVVMSAGLVTAIWLIADDQLTQVLNRAISSVTQP